MIIRRWRDIEGMKSRGMKREREEGEVAQCPYIAYCVDSNRWE